MERALGLSLGLGLRLAWTKRLEVELRLNFESGSYSDRKVRYFTTNVISMFW